MKEAMENLLELQQPYLIENMVMGSPTKHLEYRQTLGEKLANGKWAQFCEGLKGYQRQQLALLLEQTENWLKTRMEETTGQQQIGNFDKFAFPLIRAIFPNLIAQEIVSIQPMAGPTSLIFYMDYLYGSNKGNIQAGQSAFDSLSGPVDNRFYSSDDIDREPIITVPAGGSVGPFTANLAYIPVQPGTLMVKADAITGYDDGNGNITGTGITAGTIDYQTGQIATLTYAAAVPEGTVIQATYRYNSEANENIPQVDLQLISSPVTARHRKLRARWSIEAQAALRSLHGIEAASELASFTAAEIKFEIDREIIHDLYSIAVAGHVNWSSTIPAGVSWTEHKLSFIDACIELGNMIYKATRRGQPNFLIVSIAVANVIESLPLFVAEPNALSTQQTAGVVKSGTLSNRWVVFKDPDLGVGQQNPKIFFAGYKGSSFLDTGFVFAPYLPLYTTPTIYLDDFIGRKGLGTAYGKRAVNPRFYGTGAIVA